MMIAARNANAEPHTVVSPSPAAARALLAYRALRAQKARARRRALRKLPARPRP